MIVQLLFVFYIIDSRDFIIIILLFGDDKSDLNTDILDCIK